MKLLHGSLLCLLPLLAGCAMFGGKRGDVAMATPASPPAWRDVATDADRDRIRNWRNGWQAALAKVSASGQSARVTALGPLMNPDAALVDPAPPPGDYRCRTFKLGSQISGGQDFLAYPAFRCRVAMEKDVLSLTKIDGSQRPVGLVFPGDENRMIFLGTMMLGDEQRALDYGRDAERDMAGAVERVGPRQWRLVLPYPRWESTLDVIELVPAA